MILGLESCVRLLWIVVLKYGRKKGTQRLCGDSRSEVVSEIIVAVVAGAIVYEAFVDEFDVVLLFV